MDTIYLRDLRVDTVIGVWDWERKIRQTLIMDIELGCDISKAGRVTIWRIRSTTKQFATGSWISLAPASSS